jgi:serine/threonine protein kinase
MIYELYQEA